MPSNKPQVETSHASFSTEIHQIDVVDQFSVHHLKVSFISTTFIDKREPVNDFLWKKKSSK